MLTKLPLVAIVGNPNSGKTTLFNALTGSHQKVGNYAGVTVEKVSSEVTVGSRLVECIDVPGLYSLNAVSEDERVAVKAIEGKDAELSRPDLLVVTIDAGNLSRNLFVWTQIAELGIPAILALTMGDRLEGRGQRIDIPKLQGLIGVDVVPIVGHKEKGISDLLAAIDRNLESPKVPTIELGFPDVVEREVEELQHRMSRGGMDLSRVEIRRAILTPTDDFRQYEKDFPEFFEAVEAARERIAAEGGVKPTVDATERYKWTARVAHAVVQRVAEPKRTRTDRIDAFLTHRVFGLGFFSLLMYIVFQSIYTLARPIMDLITHGFAAIGAWVSPHLERWPAVQSFVVDGIIGGVGSMLVFLPQILILFFFIAVLEGTGYLARAAFLMDKLLGWCGLNGRAFIPLLSSFACAIPGIMSARVMPDTRSRLATILVAPLMSCSARLPVYLLLIGAFVEPQYGPFWAGIALFGMHLVGLAVAIPIVWFLNRKVLRGKRLPFVLELPPYQWPKWRDVWLAMYYRGKVFVTTAGTIIVFMSALIWVLSYFPRSAETQERIRAQVAREYGGGEDAQRMIRSKLLEESYLGRFGKTLEPVFAPAGFDWRITTSILSAFPARETVVPSLGILFNLQDAENSQDLSQELKRATWPDGRPLITPWSAWSLMVFFALCCQCMGTLATIKRETNSTKWPLFVFSYMTILAYIFAVGINQLGLHLAK